MSLLSLSQPSEAQIVYTPANQTIGRNGTYNLDLNHDGITDFTIKERAGQGFLGGGASTRQSLAVRGAGTNRVNCPYAYCLSTFVYAAALQPGSEIGSEQRRHGWLPGFAQMADEQHFNGNTYFFDEWNQVTNLYLGLRFQIDGETHFGWARLSVKFVSSPPKSRAWQAQLTGYAYETTPGKSIQAGRTSEEDGDAAALPQPELLVPGRQPPARARSLAALALGSDGLALWRREESEAK